MALIQVLCFGEALVDRLGPQADYLGGAPANGACALARPGRVAAPALRPT
jgi:fructokinase